MEVIVPRIILLQTEFSDAPVFKNKRHEVGQAIVIISKLPTQIIFEIEVRG